MTRDELAAEVAAEVRSILAKLKEATAPWMPGSDAGDDMVDAAAYAMHAAEPRARRPSHHEQEVAAFVANPPIPFDEMRRRIRERGVEDEAAAHSLRAVRRATEHLVDGGPVEVTFDSASLDEAGNTVASIEGVYRPVSDGPVIGRSPRDPVPETPDAVEQMANDPAIREARDAARRFAEQARSGASVAAPAVGGQEWNVEMPQGPDFLSLFSRLLALLELSPGEREFVQAIADANTTDGPAEAYPYLEIFGDWLEDQGRIGDSVRVRKVSPADGDVLVLTNPHVWKAGSVVGRTIQATADQIREGLRAAGRKVLVFSLPVGSSLQSLDAIRMQAGGWIRVREHEAGFSNLWQELDGEPENKPGTLMSHALLEMIRRLKRENAELRSCGRMDRGNVEVIRLEEREACARIVEAMQGDGGGVASAVRDPRTHPPL